MGVGHVPQDPLRPEGPGADVQGRQRRRAAAGRAVAEPDPSRAAVAALVAARRQRQGPRRVEPNRAARARGQWGEDQAADWYLRAGYTVLDRNWSCELGEIDLIVRQSSPALDTCDSTTIVFVEVKARRTARFGAPESAVGWHKQRRLRSLAARYLAGQRLHDVAVRFDVVAICGHELTVIASAF